MNNFEIEWILLHNYNTKQYFGGIYNIDNLPRIVRKTPTFLIMNTDVSTGPGKHWVAIYITENYCEFFDSAGNSPKEYGIEQFLFSNGSKYVYNSRRLQDYDSDTCGHFVLYYTYQRCLGKSIESIVRSFDYQPLNVNDDMVKHFVFQLM